MVGIFAKTDVGNDQQSGTACLTARTAWAMMPASLVASLPVASFLAGMPKSITPPRPRSAACGTRRPTGRARVDNCPAWPRFPGGLPARPHEQRQHQVGRRQPGLLHQPANGRMIAEPPQPRGGKAGWLKPGPMDVMRGSPVILAIRKGTVPFSSDENRDSPRVVLIRRWRRFLLASQGVAGAASGSSSPGLAGVRSSITAAVDRLGPLRVGPPGPADRPRPVAPPGTCCNRPPGR